MEVNWKKNQFSIRKNEILYLLGSLCIPQTIWLEERPRGLDYLKT